MNLNKSIKPILAFTLSVITAWSYAQQSPVYSLEACQKLALKNNRKIKSAYFETEASRSSAKVVNANAYPSINGSVLGVYLGSPLGGALGGMIPEYMVNGSVTASQPIYTGGKIRYGKQAATNVTTIREQQQIIAQADVIVEVERAYWQVVQVNEKIILASRYKDMLQVLHQDLKNSFDAGMIYKNDLLRVEVSLNEAELNINQANDGLVMAKLNLAQIIGVPNQTSFTLSDSVTVVSVADATFDMNAADSRPEIMLLKKSIETEELQRKILRADQLPTFGISASGVAVTGKKVNIEDGSNFMATYYGLASISVPIFEWGKRANKVAEQSFKIEARKQEAEQTRELINLEIQNAYLQLIHSSKKVKLSTLSLDQARENLRLADDRFKAGTIVAKDVQEAQAIWQQAYSALIDSRVELKVNTVLYKKAIGELK